MFKNADLKTYLTTSDTISISSLVIAEWNMNLISNIEYFGNYKYRPSDQTSLYKNIPNFIQKGVYCILFLYIF